MTFETIEPSALAGMTRAQLLDICRQRGLAATAWKRGRMEAVLTGEEPAPEPRARANGAPDPEDRIIARLSDERQSGEAARKAAENREKRAGACESVVCRERCPAYEPGDKDPFGWQLCVCGHTQWAHAEAAPGAGRQ